MTKEISVVNVDENTTYEDIDEAVVENVEHDNVESSQQIETMESETVPKAKAKARAKRVAKPKPVEPETQ